MTLRWYTLVVDSTDPQALARWWAETLDWQIVHDTPEECAVIPRDMAEEPERDLRAWLRAGQGLVFVPVPEGKTVKNRLHIDLAPTPPRTGTPRSRRSWTAAPPGWTSARTRTTSPGPSSPTPRATSSACSPAGTADTAGAGRAPARPRPRPQPP